MINKKWTNDFNYKVITKQLTEISEIARNIDHNENQNVVFDTTQVQLQNTLHDRQTQIILGNWTLVDLRSTTFFYTGAALTQFLEHPWNITTVTS